MNNRQMRPFAPRHASPNQTPTAQRPFFGAAPLSLSQHKREVDKRSRPGPNFNFLPKSPPKPACAVGVVDISTPIFGVPGYQTVAPQAWSPVHLPRPTFHHHHHHHVGQQFAPSSFGPQFRPAAPATLAPSYRQPVPTMPRATCPLHQPAPFYPDLKTMETLQVLSQTDNYCPKGLVRSTNNQQKFDTLFTPHLGHSGRLILLGLGVVHI